MEFTDGERLGRDPVPKQLYERLIRALERHKPGSPFEGIAALFDPKASLVTLYRSLSSYQLPEMKPEYLAVLDLVDDDRSPDEDTLLKVDEALDGVISLEYEGESRLIVLIHGYFDALAFALEPDADPRWQHIATRLETLLRESWCIYRHEFPQSRDDIAAWSHRRSRRDDLLPAALRKSVFRWLGMSGRGRKLTSREKYIVDRI